jgi:UDP-3-O-[3-hydroxymyristoyl] glucosamine N-acyltransferase LpxD
MPLAPAEHFSVKLPDLTKYERYTSYAFRNYTVTGVSSLDRPANNTILFANKVTESTKESLQSISGSLILVPRGQKAVLGAAIADNNEIFECNTPRLEYAIMLTLILGEQPDIEERHSSNFFVSPKAVIGTNVIIEDFAYIDAGVTIGDNCVIRSGAKIYPRVTMGDNCIIGANAVVGHEGFGFEKDEDGNNTHIPHLGGVLIGDYVQVGVMTTVISGTIHATVIEDYTKIDDHVHIGHNMHVGKNCIITAGTIFAGRVRLEDNAWIGPNTSVRQNVLIGKNAFVGIGSVVLNDVPEGAVIVGNPGKPLKKG